MMNGFRKVTKLRRKNILGVIIEEEEEVLPPYDCTVYKEGYVKLKCEILRGRSEIDRSWRSVYFKLTGTKLAMFYKETDVKPFLEESMYKAFCGVPLDYFKRDNVLRLTMLPVVDQFLFQPEGGLVQIISWFEHLNSAANISPDIDRRKMPKILTHPREHSPIRHRVAQNRTVTFLVGEVQVYVPILACLRDLCGQSYI